MRLDFAEIKRISILEVAARFGIQFRYRGEWANAPCPLPSHRKDDKGRNFTVNVRENYWRCFSESCNEANGGKKGGDVINFVALMENCREKQAAEKLAGWFSLKGSENGMGRNKKAEHIAPPPKEENNPQRAPSNNTPKTENGKGYMHEVGVKMESLLVVIADETIRKQVKKEVMNAVYDSYKNGKAAIH